ncbi:MAG TPA: hypothetical protein VNZ52_06590 [Candidatus Thermoplasmatota archaeon]|nr:hypothetical protein [Candidatus Thermoplasmatota archaeon]
MARVMPIVLLALLMAPLLAATPAAAQGLPRNLDPKLLGPVLESAAHAAMARLENETGENLSAEDVDLRIEVNLTNAEFDLVGALLGGGKVQTDFTVRGHFEFRVLSLKRLDQAFQEASGSANVSLADTLGYNSSRTYVTAEEFRLIGGGAALEAFREVEAAAARRLVEAALPGVVVLSSTFEWSNLVPGEQARDGRPTSLRDPPVVLDITFQLQFLDRVALSDLLADYLDRQAEEAAKGKDPATILKERIKENQTVPLLEQSAFMILGIDQLVAMNVPPGWRLNLTFTVPRGFTIEGATDELLVSPDKRTATYYADGSQAFTALDRASVLTLSSRSLVVPLLVAGTLVVGFVLRIVVENGARFWWRRHSRTLKVSFPAQAPLAASRPLEEPPQP